nr:unnamed protein product [Callosobruchus analis]
MLGCETGGSGISGGEEESILAGEIAEVEKAMNLSVPKRLVRILEINGIFNMRLLAELCTDDIKNIENYTKTVLPNIIDKQDYEKYFGVFAKSVQHFQFSVGDMKIIDILKNHARKKLHFTLKDDLEPCQSLSLRQSRSSLATDSFDMEKCQATPEMTSDVPPEFPTQDLKPHGGYDSSSDIVDERDDIDVVSEILRKWLESHCSNNQLSDIATQFNQIKFDLYKDPRNNTFCKIKCFCMRSYTVSKLSKHGKYKRKWVLGIYIYISILSQAI